MGAQSYTLESAGYTAATETDLYVNASTTTKAISLGIDCYNPESSGVSAEIWVTDGSNVHKGCPLFKDTVGAKIALSNSRKYVIKPGYKIRVISAVNTVSFETSVLEGLL